MNDRRDLPPALERARLPALLIGLLCLGVSCLGLWSGPRHQFFLSYLEGYLFWIGIPLGAMAILMLQHLTGGAWGLALRRPLESLARMLPFMALLFLPLLFGLEELYVWTGDPRARGVSTSPLRAFYLATPFFVIRSAVYFAVWLVLAFLLNRWSREEDRTGDPGLGRRFQLLSGAGLVLYGLTATFAGVDWVMSLTPEWSSSIFGVVFMAGQGLEGLTSAIVLVALLSKGPLAEAATPELFHDLGNLLLAFLMFWAYVAFSQYLIIWAADIAPEAPYYVYRTTGGWQWLALCLIALHFFAPFFLLLLRWAKRRRGGLCAVAAGILLLRPVDLHWMVAPAYSQGRGVRPVPGLHVHWLDLVLPLGLGGLWIWVFLGQLKRGPLLPLHDPRLGKAAAHG